MKKEKSCILILSLFLIVFTINFIVAEQVCNYNKNCGGTKLSNSITCPEGTSCPSSPDKLCINPCTALSETLGVDFAVCDIGIISTSGQSACCAKTEKCPADYVSPDFCTTEGNLAHYKYHFEYNKASKTCISTKEFVTVQNCVFESLSKYSCSCVFGTSSCNYEIIKGSCSNSKCIEEKTNDVLLKQCKNGCDFNINSKNYGHCNADCNPKCTECQECFTWNTESYCTAGVNGKKCSFVLDDSSKSTGVCKDGKCTASACNPVEKFCEKCDATKNPPVAVPDSGKNGMKCTEGILSILDEGFCDNGECKKKSCENLGLNLECGKGWNKKVCCDSKTQICCGANGNSPICCNKETETCGIGINSLGFGKAGAIIDNLKKKNGENYIPNLLEKIAIVQAIFSDTKNFFYFCQPKKDKCEEAGKKLCYQKYGSACCPKEGPGSVCGTYDFVPPLIVQIFSIGMPQDTPEFFKPDFKIAVCGSEKCTEDSFACDNTMQKGNVVCCKKAEEVCSYDAPFGSPKTNFGGIYAPRCQPLMYCNSGYSSCSYKDYKICCKDGEETCFIQNNRYPQCVKIAKK